ncbi:MAG TPA: hypothetical protein DEB06_03610 [Phycisphaerales bacterium]|nr:hypothetical protein [Phycisphaerales bacterium]
MASAGREEHANGPLAEGGRDALREMLVIAAPAAASMLSFALMQFVDRLLCSRLISPEALMAAGNGGIAAWVPSSVVMGALGVVNTYVSQNLGAGRAERGPAYAWAGIWIAMVAWALVLLPFAVAFPWVYDAMRSALGLPGVSEHVRHMEAMYGRIMLGGTVLTLGARSLGHYFYGMHRPGIVLGSTIGGNAVNLVVSVALVLWAMGREDLAPEPRATLALAGAAAGTVVGTLVECAIPLVVFLSPAFNRKYATRASWRPSSATMRDIWRIGWPGGVMFGNEMVCWWIFMGGFVAAFDRGAAQAVHGPAGWITHQYLMLSFMPAVGISIATTAVVGRCIGAGRHDLAASRTWLGLRLTLTYMGACALAFIIFGPSMAMPFLPEGVSAEQGARIIELTRWMLVLAATFQLFDGMAITISGALRGAGDTVWPGVVTIFMSWGLIVGGGWLAVNFLPGLESYGPWAAASAYIITLSLLLLWRFLGGKWRSIRVLRDPVAGEGVEGGHPVLASDPGPGALAMAPGLDIPADPPPLRGVENRA